MYAFDEQINGMKVHERECEINVKEKKQNMKEWEGKKAETCEWAKSNRMKYVESK